jgi:hypothetical protein
MDFTMRLVTAQGFSCPEGQQADRKKFHPVQAPVEATEMPMKSWGIKCYKI